jgi:hypothetical protein
MLSLRYAALAAICFGGPSTLARADVLVTTSPGSALALDLAEAGFDIEMTPEFGPKLIGGTPAPAGMFPVTVVIRSGNSSCTAQLSGERVLASAAHCMPNGGTVTFKLGGKSHSAKCAHSPHYRTDKTSDYALCLTKEPITGVEFENLDFTTGWCSVGQEVMLSGYGCTKPGGGGGNDGVLRYGYAEILRCPSSDNDIVIKGQAALCFGDSGGPTYRLQADGRRTVLGQNSRGNIKTTSYLPAWYRQRGLTFAQDWSKANAVKICGLHVDAKGCRDALPDLPDPAAECKAALAHLGKCLEGSEDLLKCNASYETLGECLDAVEQD